MVLLTGRRITNRWTGARIASFSTCLVRRRLNVIAAPGQLKRWASSFEVSRCNFHPNSDPKSKLDLNGRKNHFLGVSPKIVRLFIFAGVLDTTVIFRPMAT